MFNLNSAGGFTAPIYKHSQMMEFTGVRLQTFRQWLRNGAFEAGITHDDKSKAYSLGDLLKIRLINELVISGSLPVAAAVDAAELAGDWLEENHAKGGAVDAETFLIAYPYGGPSIASNAADMGGILNANEGPAKVIRLSKFLSCSLEASNVSAREAIGKRVVEVARSPVVASSAVAGLSSSNAVSSAIPANR